MKPNPDFVNLPKDFWAHVRTISEITGYTYSKIDVNISRRKKVIKVPSPLGIKTALAKLNLSSSHLLGTGARLTDFGKLLLDYFKYRAEILVNYVEPNLMDVKEAKNEFERLYYRLNPSCPIPLNKQKGEKRAPAYFTGIINMLIENNSEGISCDYDPHQLTTTTRDNKPLRTLARRVDGAFPNIVNPIAIWEIKEYYYTTTFGSRVADGVYETLLDGMELEELFLNELMKVRHYLMLDSHFTWWECGTPYLCRIIDMLHMGYVDEVLFGKEVINGLPSLVKEWVQEERYRLNS